MVPARASGAPVTRAERQRGESVCGLRNGGGIGKAARARKREMRQVRLHRYQWALRRLFNEARLERMKPQAVRA
jgi:hypothetical protein